jgi:hypothetical protein
MKIFEIVTVVALVVVSEACGPSAERAAGNYAVQVTAKSQVFGPTAKYQNFQQFTAVGGALRMDSTECPALFRPSMSGVFVLEPNTCPVDNITFKSGYLKFQDNQLTGHIDMSAKTVVIDVLDVSEDLVGYRVQQ